METNDELKQEKRVHFCARQSGEVYGCSAGWEDKV